MPTLEKAISIALEAHKGKGDKAGAPYIPHPLRVMFQMDTEEEMIAAVLHDVVEDSDYSLEKLREIGFSERVIEAVDSVTKRAGESYEDFVRRAPLNPIGRKVKLADLRDNLDLSRLNEISDKDLERIAKYHTALRFLQETKPSENRKVTRAEPSISRIYGVDFSGAKDAGRHIWITEGIVKDGSLHIVRCERCEDLPHSSKELEPCLEALKEFIASCNGSAVGLDFPFGLPKELVKENTWQDFVKAFPKKYRDPDTFRNTCLTAASGKELKRCTDREAKTPFCCYNLRLYKQTYYGISRLLAPLVEENRVRVLPTQDPEPDKPWVLEICPASALKRLDLYKTYKKNTEEQREARSHILSELELRGQLKFTDESLRNKVLSDSGGDALDSVIAAFTTFKVVQNPESVIPEKQSDYMLEGYVYL